MTKGEIRVSDFGRLLFGNIDSVWQMVLLLVIYALLLGSIFMAVRSVYVRVEKSGVLHKASKATKEKFSLSYMKRKNEEEEFWNEYGMQEKMPLLYRLDRLIDYCGLRSTFKFASADILVLIFAILIIGGFFVGYATGLGIILGMLLGVAFSVVIYTVMRFIADQNFDLIENNMVSFVNAVSTESKSSDDLITILDNAKTTLCRPLRRAIVACCTEARATGKIDLALHHFELNIENFQMKKIIRNLGMCVHTNADYSKIIDQCRLGLKEHIAAREERKAINGNNRTAIIGMVALGVVGLFLTGNIVETSNVFTYLWSFQLGRIVLIYTLAVLFYCVISLFISRERN